MTPALPPGFELDSGPAGTPPPPPGFDLDGAGPPAAPPRPGTNDAIPQAPGMRAPVQLAPPSAAPPTFGDTVTGAVEAGLNLATSLVGGAIGSVTGFAQNIGEGIGAVTTAADRKTRGLPAVLPGEQLPQLDSTMGEHIQGVTAALKRTVHGPMDLSLPDTPDTALGEQYTAAMEPAMASLIAAAPLHGTVGPPGALSSGMRAVPEAVRSFARDVPPAARAAAADFVNAGGDAAQQAAGRAAAERPSMAAQKAAREAKLAGPENQGIVDAIDAGYKVTPKAGRGGAPSRMVQSAAGSARLEQELSAHNSENTARLARADLGLPDDVPLTPEVTQQVRREAGDAYNVLDSAGRVSLDDQFRSDVARVSEPFVEGGKDFSQLAKNPIIEAAQNLAVDAADTRSIIEVVKDLRNKSDIAYRGGDKQLGNGYRALAQAADNAMDRALTRGEGSPGIPEGAVDAYRAARVRIAKSYLADDAMNGKPGEIDARVYGRALQKGARLSGPGLQIAQFAKQFGDEGLAKKAGKSGSVGPTYHDILLAGLHLARGGAEALLTAGARPGARAILGSKVMQTRLRNRAAGALPAEEAPRPPEPPPEPTTTPGAGPGTPPPTGSGPGPLGDLTPDWGTTPGAGGGGAVPGIEPQGLVRAVGEPPVTTGNPKARLEIPAVPGRPDLPDTLVSGGPAETAATSRANRAMLEPGAIEARAQQGDAAMRRENDALRARLGIPVGEATRITPEYIVADRAWRKEFGLGEDEAQRATDVAAALQHDAPAVEAAARQFERSPRAFDREIERINAEGETRATQTEQPAGGGESNAAATEGAKPPVPSDGGASPVQAPGREAAAGTEGRGPAGAVRAAGERGGAERDVAPAAGRDSGDTARGSTPDAALGERNAPDTKPDDQPSRVREEGPAKAVPEGAKPDDIEEVFSQKGEESDQVFYSPLRRAVDALKIGKGSAGDWENALRGLASKGVKPEEIEWSGVKDWLRAQGKSITKDEVVNFLRQGGVKVEEVIKHEGDAPGDAKYGDSYQLPGGTNYREVLLTLPDARTVGGPRVEGRDPRAANNYQSPHWQEPNVLAHIRLNDRTDAQGRKVLFVEEVQSDWAQQGKKRGFDTGEKEPLPEPKVKPGERMELMRTMARETKAKLTKQVGEDEASTIIAGMGERELADMSGRNAERMDLISRENEDRRAMDEHHNRNTGLPPKAPFVGNTSAWTALAIKRIAKMAADEGYDRVAFINGEQSAERYDLSKQISKLEHDGDQLVAYDHNGREVMRERTEPTAAAMEEYIGKEPALKLEKAVKDAAASAEYDRKQWDVELDEDSGKYGVVDPNGEWVYDRDGDLELWSDQHGAERWIDENYREGADDNPVGSIEGLDLKVGGEGMKAFYDKIVPNVAKDVVRRLGGEGLTKVDIVGRDRAKGQYSIRQEADGRWQIMEGERETQSPASWFKDEAEAQKVADMRNGFEARTGTQQLGFDITDKMREQTAGGVPLFRQGEANRPVGTPERMEQVLRDKFGDKLVQGLLDQGVLRMMLSADDTGHGVIPPRRKAVFRQGEHVRPAATLYVDRVSAAEAPGVLMHELGEHFGIQRVLGNERYALMLSELRDLRREPEVRDAWATVKKNYTSLAEDNPVFLREVAAHLVENHPDLPFVRRLINEIRAFFYEQFGTTLGNRVDANLVRGLAASALRKASKGDLPNMRRYVRFDGTPIPPPKAPTRGTTPRPMLQ